MKRIMIIFYDHIHGIDGIPSISYRFLCLRREAQRHPEAKGKCYFSHDGILPIAGFENIPDNRAVPLF
jgi:hypothetical protein